ncbi:tripartite tricarboxylate transporter permease, partial [Proteus terrae]|uniref:tripartite tricarboxylate transporter permease n=1 Tax=Proteus terrae TaxID=1574161 RepID=UPI0033154C7C
MTLGIPGDGATAIIMGAFMVQGLALGPQLFTDNPVEVTSIFIGLMMTKIFLGIFGVLCSVGAYSVNHSIIDVFVMMGAGLLAYIMIKLDFSMSPVVIG